MFFSRQGHLQNSNLGLTGAQQQQLMPRFPPFAPTMFAQTQRNVPWPPTPSIRPQAVAFNQLQFQQQLFLQQQSPFASRHIGRQPAEHTHAAPNPWFAGPPMLGQPARTHTQGQQPSAGQRSDATSNMFANMPPEMPARPETQDSQSGPHSDSSLSAVSESIFD